MTYIGLIEFLADFTFIKVIESTFMILMTMTLSKIKLEKQKVVLSIFICSVTSMILIPFGQNEVLPRLIFLFIIAMTVLSVNRTDKVSVLNVYLNLFIVVMITVIIEFFSFLPFLIFLGDDMYILQESIFLAILCSIPTRVFQYIVCYLLYIKIGGKNEKIN